MNSYGNFRKLYSSLRRIDLQKVAVRDQKDLAEIQEIWTFYEKLSTDELRLLGAAVKKTEAQLGYIPFCFSTVPIVFVIFASKLSTLIAPSVFVLSLTVLVLCLLAIFLIHRHFTHKSYNALHLHVIETILDLKSGRNETDNFQPSTSMTCGTSS